MLVCFQSGRVIGAIIGYGFIECGRRGSDLGRGDLGVFPSGDALKPCLKVSSADPPLPAHLEAWELMFAQHRIDRPLRQLQACGEVTNSQNFFQEVPQL